VKLVQVSATTGRLTQPLGGLTEPLQAVTVGEVALTNHFVIVSFLDCMLEERHTAALSSMSMTTAAEGAGTLSSTSMIAAEGAGAAPTVAVVMAMAKTKRVENIAVKL
jgi:hypothetical protein